MIYEHVDWNDPLRRGYYERNREYIAEVSPLEACVTEDPIVVMYLGSVNVMREAATVLRSLATKLRHKVPQGLPRRKHQSNAVFRSR